MDKNLCGYSDGWPRYVLEFGKASLFLFQFPTLFEDADPSQDYTFSPISIEIEDVTDQYTIQLSDYDDGISDNDFMVE